ncbi:nuclear transport factor 2 family protein [Streptomyces sp. NPDC086033]|uniref:nuclear transport factor 2 family protein n=1 Tax=Streptomyces sp. NPDC086033 TaxID=3365747 RepID=UPI0037CFC210
MSGDEELLARLERQVRNLKDRQEILDCVARHAHGHDRFDADLLTAAYHQDGVDEHGATVNSGPAYAQWANMIHAKSAELHTHNITTHLCEIDEDGDTAHCESYVLVGLLSHDGRTAQLMSGRYLDRLERRDGTWRIAVRRCTVDLALSADASVLRTPFFSMIWCGTLGVHAWEGALLKLGVTCMGARVCTVALSGVASGFRCTP